MDGDLAGGTPAETNGTWWMYHGVDFDLMCDFQAAASALERERSSPDHQSPGSLADKNRLEEQMAAQFTRRM